ncbi:hypothetical protein SBI_09230 [Streptomyces bingchenggensis BCW-1]|uniref:Uncharacterized protein n=1 Tax=Streptomyces bingchenggensis (strain BCW-1) TaxID=749414 RepID=D7C3Y2_STRBB|nr:hypothetical protein SBI_09230 [Streptomyces bingchenggensis BCW-1]
MCGVLGALVERRQFDLAEGVVERFVRHGGERGQQIARQSRVAVQPEP